MAQSQERSNVVFDDFYNQDEINSLKKRCYVISLSKSRSLTQILIKYM